MAEDEELDFEETEDFSHNPEDHEEVIDWSENEEGNENDMDEEEDEETAADEFTVVDDLATMGDMSDLEDEETHAIKKKVANEILEASGVKPAAPVEETPSASVQIVEGMSVAYHLGVLKNDIQRSEKRSSYQNTLKKIQQAFETRDKSKPPGETQSLPGLKMNLSEELFDDEHHKGKKRILKFQVPLIQILLKVFDFLPDISSRNMIVAWLLHPGHSKQLTHILKNAFGAPVFWKTLLTKSQKIISNDLKVPRHPLSNVYALPVVPLNKTKTERKYNLHESCPYYHEDKKCRRKIVGIRSSVSGILNKYDLIPKKKWVDMKAATEHFTPVIQPQSIEHKEKQEDGGHASANLPSTSQGDLGEVIHLPVPGREETKGERRRRGRNKKMKNIQWQDQRRQDEAMGVVAGMLEQQNSLEQQLLNT